MKWPWVSRKRFEDLEQRFEKVDTERQSLLRDLLEQRQQPQAPQTSVEEDSARPTTFITPFDSARARFRQAGAAAKKEKFKARIR